MREPYQALGRRLLAIRHDLAAREGCDPGLSQRQMADRLVETWIDGVSATQTQVSRWEKGKARPRRATLKAYAQVAGEDELHLLRLAGYGYIDDRGETELAREEAAAQPAPASPNRLPPPSPAPSAAGQPLAIPSRRSARLRGWWLAAPVAVVLLVAAGVAYRGTSPSNATEAWVGGSRLEVMAGDRRLWSLGLPKGLMPAVKPLVHDLDGDGRNEVVVSLDPAGPARETGRLVCFTSDGTRHWVYPYGRRIVIGERRFTPFFVARHLALLDTAAGLRILLVLFHEQWFPAQVVLLDPRSGTPAGEYWHPGYLEVFTTFDVDSDGTMELVLGGVNNPGDGPGRPALAVLDLPFRPAAEPDAVFSLTHSLERAYLLFPRPDLHHEQTELASVHVVRPEGNGRLLVGISTPAGNSLFYTLDSSLAVADLRVSDSFIHDHDRLLDHRYSVAERESWRDLLRFDRAPDANSLGRLAAHTGRTGAPRSPEASPPETPAAPQNCS